MLFFGIYCICYLNSVFYTLVFYYRCYNCGDFGNHIASKCPHGPLPKRCHNCKSTEHLIADCPLRDPSMPVPRNGSGSGSGTGNGLSP